MSKEKKNNNNNNSTNIQANSNSKNNKSNTNNTKTYNNNKHVSDEESKIELVIDNTDRYLDKVDSVVYFHNKRMIQLFNIREKTFDSVLIRNTSVEDITSLALKYIAMSMKVDSNLTVVIENPLTVMQIHDAKQIEANAVLAGFASIEIVDYEEEDVNGNVFKTKALTAIKPQRNPNATEIEIEVKTTTKTTKDKDGRINTNSKTYIGNKSK